MVKGWVINTYPLINFYTIFVSGGAQLMKTKVRVHLVFVFVNVEGCGGVEMDG